jgi:hypothetical protein
MYRLRDCFEPLDSIARSCTLSFLYRGGIAPHLAELGRPDPRPTAEIDATWDAIDAYWATFPCPELRPRLRMHRISHHFGVGGFERARLALTDFAETFDLATAGSDAPQVAHAWRYMLDVMRWQLTQHEDVDPALARTVETLRERELPGETRRSAWSRASGGTPWPNAFLCERLWRSVAQRCRAQGWRRVGLYGAGQHTRKLLASGWPHGIVELVAVLDDNAPDVAIDGFDVIDPGHAQDLPDALDAIVISSDVYEGALAARARRLFGADGLPIVRVYTDEEEPAD